MEAKTRKEVADKLGISIRTLQRWIIKYKVDAPKGGRLPPKSQRQLHERVGDPDQPEQEAPKPPENESKG